jgi:hypothetical protein
MRSYELLHTHLRERNVTCECRLGADAQCDHVEKVNEGTCTTEEDVRKLRTRVAFSRIE